LASNVSRHSVVQNGLLTVLQKHQSAYLLGNGTLSNTNGIAGSVRTCERVKLSLLGFLLTLSRRGKTGNIKE